MSDPVHNTSLCKHKQTVSFRNLQSFLFQNVYDCWMQPTPGGGGGGGRGGGYKRPRGVKIIRGLILREFESRKLVTRTPMLN